MVQVPNQRDGDRQSLSGWSVPGFYFVTELTLIEEKKRPENKKRSAGSTLRI